MKEYIKIAWRNLWRNRKRTAITSASILFAVFFALIMRSMQLGSYDNMIKNAIEKYMGFIQIQNIDFEDDPGLNNSFEYNAEMIDKLEKLEGIKAVVPRIESFSLASYGTQTKGVMVLGVDMELEANLSNPNSRLVKYRFTKENIKELKNAAKFPEKIIKNLDNCINNSYPNTESIELDLDLDDELSEKYLPIIQKITAFEGNGLTKNDDGVLVADRLAKFLHLNIGDTLVMMGQGYHGVSAAGLFPVKGIIKLPSPDLDNKLVYMTLKNSQYFFGMQDMVTTISINLFDNSDENMKAKQNEIADVLQNQQLTVRNWKEFNKVLHQQIEGDNQSGKAMLVLLYVIIFFGIFGTILMMIHERYRELGVMISIGMQKTKLAIVMFFEMLFMGIIGVVLGTLVSLPILYLGNRYPLRLTGDLAKAIESMGMEAVLPLEWIDSYVFWQGAIVAVMVILIWFYPLVKIMKLEVVKALRS
jgi:ABC-type lipoprotein release transport system permease subunit